MRRNRETSPMFTGRRRAQLHDMLTDDEIVKEYQKHVARLAEGDNASGDHPEAQDIAAFSDVSLCQTLAMQCAAKPGSPVYLGRETVDGFDEMLFYDVLFVKSTTFPPLPDRRYKNPGALFHSISLIAPPGEQRMERASDAMKNLYLCMSTASSTRRFLNIVDRFDHDDQKETYLTNPTFTCTEDIDAGRVSSKACAIPPSFDANGAMQRVIEASRGRVCFTPENLFRVCDLTVPGGAPRSAVFPSPDAVVTGQLVYVTFVLRGVSLKPVGSKKARAGSAATYGFRPTLRSVFILSKAGPMAMQRNTLYKTVRSDMMDGVQEALQQPTEQDISRDLKRLRITL